jgi:riboflavin kinase/FMN adenylyltransferase
LGHQAIIRATLDRAAAIDADPVVFTFSPHPVAVLAPSRAPALITSLAERLRLLRASGIAGVVMHRFTVAFASLEPDQFVQRFMLDALGASAVVVGYNVSFGHDRKGTPAVLEDLGRRLGLTVTVVPPILVGERRVSSSAIRQAVEAGQVSDASMLLGRAHSVRGRVCRGERRGAGIGFPTANILPRGGLLPPDGVYAVRVGIGNETPRRPGVANLGTNPTFGAVARRLESHLFDFDGDLYGANIRVAFEKRLRGEVKFPSVEALVRQIRADAGEARQLLGEPT